jgi:uncharacterized iron-regulated membrane protein
MAWRKTTYVVHRWLGLIISLQLLAWSLGGLVFSVLAIERVRGVADAKRNAPAALDPYETLFNAAEALNLARLRVDERHEIVELALIERRETLVYEARDAKGRGLVLVDAHTGAVLPPLTPEEAARVAVDDFVHPGSASDVILLESDPPLEYRGKPLPAYRVELDHPKQPHIYVDTVTGEVSARRNRVWRIFDFFWMLHIMDYDERDDFNHPLLILASLGAVLTSASGVALWGWRLARRLR